MLHRPHVTHLVVLAAAAFLLPLGTEARAQSHPPPLTAEQVAYARAAVDSLTRDPRGPYLRLRWFCRDGSAHPPQGTPCRERGGGNQHAELGETAKRLARLHLNVGTILQATDYETFFDAAHLHDRLKQYVIEDYLVMNLDGWVLRRARTYRGARQAEDEEARGTQLLVRLLSDPAWVADHFWLTTRLVAAMPHVGLGGAESHYRIRHLATEVAELDAEFLPLRVRIHSFPSPADVQAVERFLERPGLSPQARVRVTALRDALRQHYDRRLGAETLAEYARRIGSVGGLGPRLDTLRLQLLGRADDRETLRRLALLSSDVRRHILSGSDGSRNLLLMDLLHRLHDQGAALAAALAARPKAATRRERLQDLEPHVILAHAGGLVSARERDALLERIRILTSRDTVTAEMYRRELTYLGRGLEWGTSTVESSLYPALRRFTRVEPAAGRFVEVTVRASSLLPVASALAELTADADRLLGTSHLVLGEHPRTGIRGLNAGRAVGPLRVVEDASADLDASGIYVLPETTTELTPVAGVMTRDAGNLLSHVQLLARNLGIPNASISEHLVPALRAAEGRPVLFAVSPAGRVVLEDTARLAPAQRSLLPRPGDEPPARHRLDASRLRMDAADPIPLSRLRASDAGVVVGPKAANLGELAVVFPDRVSDAVALPFGMFRRHVDRPMPSSERSVVEELAWTRTRTEEMRRAGAGEDEIDRFVFGALERVRAAIVQLPWRPDLRAAVADAVAATFGSELSPGVFVRSDTNVEDLPQFSGAGLNLTVKNQQSVEDILSAVKRVWTSPFTERAYLWRRRVLADFGEVYPSVLLQRSVPSEKSGVVISTGLEHGGPDALTVATAEGVGGAVDGGDAETLVVEPDGRVTLLSQARAPTRQVLDRSGGTRTIPARRPERLLSDGEIRQLVGAVSTWEEHARAGGRREVWDLEFGFLDGKLWLFQARPFVRYRDSETRQRLEVLDREAATARDRPVPMDEIPSR